MTVLLEDAHFSPLLAMLSDSLGKNTPDAAEKKDAPPYYFHDLPDLAADPTKSVVEDEDITVTK